MVICYPQLGKSKSHLVLEAFAKGAGGAVYAHEAPVLRPGAAAFYGHIGREHLIREARREQRDYYYGDNGYFDVARHRFYRFAKNAFQTVRPKVSPDHVKFKALGLTVAPWRKKGGHIVVVENSAAFYKLCGVQEHWLEEVIFALKKLTDRPVKVRRWQRDKAKLAASLHSDLKEAHALVTHASAAANEALLAGVPVFVSSQECAAAPMASGELSGIESPKYPDGREEWAARLVASQWTIDEIRAGVAWGVLND